MEDVISGKWTGNWSLGHDPAMFEEIYGVPLHIHRTFKNRSNAKINKELDWVKEGGILFYSTDPEPWADYAEGASDKTEEEIRMFAQAVKEVAPHQVMVPAGYEPDLYIPET